MDPWRQQYNSTRNSHESSIEHLQCLYVILKFKGNAKVDGSYQTCLDQLEEILNIYLTPI